MAVQWHGQEVLARVRRAALEGIIEGTKAIREDAVNRILSPPKTGRIYRSRGVAHQASAPGEAPATDFGDLAGGIEIGFNESELSGTITSTMEYSARLEFGFFGTDALGRNYNQEARPFMRPALAAKKDEIERNIAAAVRAALAVRGR